MSLKIPATLDKFNQFLADVQQKLSETVIRCIENQLEAETDAWLYRQQHERRAGVTRRSSAYCPRCGTQEARAFSRNGHRKRQLVTTFGVLTFWLPRVVCECGGRVVLPFSILRPYQRIWDDVLQQIERWSQLGLSLRQMQTEIGDQLRTQVGLHKLNEVVQGQHTPIPLELTSVPPIIMLDAIWVTLLADTNTTQPDRLQRQRRRKARQKVCVLVALGLYPQSQRWGILGWQVAESESQPAWEALLLTLEQRGVYRQRGVELIIHDGGAGLIAALKLIYPTVPHQRCLFHKLRNLWHTIQLPVGLSPSQRQTFKRDLLQQVQPIFEAADESDAVRLRDALDAQWHAAQPAFIATLQRDWSETVAFLRVLRRFPDWPRTALRTTSLLERVNRMLRRLFRSAGAFHSRSGLLAAVGRILIPLRLI
jgi:transposase-like protein